MDYSKPYRAVESSIVNVITFENGNVCSTATGAIIDDGKKVLTCSHCCNNSLSTGIYDKNRGKPCRGEIIFDDQTNDIAIIGFSFIVGNPLKIVKSDSIEIGNEVFTVGFPYKFKSEKTLTVGNVAAFEDGLIKINTSVNNGNSGGPLLNMNGEIIGVVNSKLGRLSVFLESIEKQNPQAFMKIGGVDPIQVIQQMIREMQQNLNLGIGYAIPSIKVAAVTDIVSQIMK